MCMSTISHLDLRMEMCKYWGRRSVRLPCGSREEEEEKRERKWQSNASAVLHKLHVCLLVSAWSACEDYGRRLILPPQAVAGLGTCGSSYMLISTCGEGGKGAEKSPPGSTAMPPAQTSSVPR